MKTNELMIEDWVRITDDDTNTRFNARIEAIDWVGNVYAKTPGNETAYPYSIDCVEPILLTPEILKKNKFAYTKPQMPTESEDKVWQYQNNEKQTLIEIEEQMDENLLDYYIGYFASGANSCEIYFRHVHQLQHAFRLCGIETEIKL